MRDTIAKSSVQNFGNRGLFQDLYDPDQEEPRGPIRLSQYNQWTTAIPYHDIQPEITMDRDLARRWMEHVGLENKKLLRKASRMTRGEFLNAMYEALGTK